MARRGENIRKRKDGRWEGRYSVATETGKKTCSVYARTYSEVKRRLSEKKAAAAPPLPGEPGCRFGEAALQWLQFVKKERKYSTYVKYENIYRKYLEPLAGRTFEEVDAGAVERCLGPAEKEDGRRRAVYAEVNRILKYASECYGLAPRAVHPGGCKSAPKRIIHTLNQTEQVKLLRYLNREPDVCKAGVILCLSTGLRLGEVCALKWADIDLEMKVLHVNSTVQRIRVDGQDTRTMLLETEPKSAFSKREIPLSDHMVGLLRSFRGGERYFLRGSRPMEPRSYQKKLKGYLCEAGVPEKNFHALRHTFATNCVNAGTDIKSLSEILGHADVQITLNRYVHPSLDMKRQYMNSLSAIYGQIMGQTGQPGVRG